MAGRPTKYTPETAAKIVVGIRAGLTTRDAALVAGVHEDTVANWERRYSAFSAQLARAHAERSANWLARIATLAAEQRDWRAYAELLDRCAPEYRKVSKSEVTGKDGGPIRHEHAALAAAVERIAAERGLDPAEVLAEAEAIVSRGAA
jgi:transposase